MSDKNTMIMVTIAVIAIFVNIIIAGVVIYSGNQIAEQNKEDVKNLISDELKKLNEQGSGQINQLNDLIQLSTPSPIINCWLSEKNMETGDYKIVIMNEGNKLTQLKNIKLESPRNFYATSSLKNFDSEVKLCELEDKWLSPGKTIIQDCLSDFKINHITLITDNGEIVCDLDRVS